MREQRGGKKKFPSIPRGGGGGGQKSFSKRASAAVENKRAEKKKDLKCKIKVTRFFPNSKKIKQF